MGLFNRFRKKKPPQTAQDYDRPSWMTDGMAIVMYEGTDDLEIVGESYRQDELWKIAGGRSRDRVRVDVVALLTAEPDNEYDPNAVAAWVAGLRVGYLSRADAARLRLGLLALEAENGSKIALGGVIAGGGLRDGQIRNLGVFLKYDPADFGLPSTPSLPVERGVRTGFSDAAFTDEEDDSYDFAWHDDLSENDLRAIEQLRDLLVDESDPIDVHYMYRELEARLYKSRNVFGSALDEYDAACRDHDAAMDTIRPALLDKFGRIPLLETYKQQAIRQQKAREFESGVCWAERGIELYGDDATDPSWVHDLKNRAAKLRVKAEGAKTPDTRVVDGTTLETLVCHTCGREFERERTKGRKPHECPNCRGDQS